MFGFSKDKNKVEKPNYVMYDPDEMFREDVEIALARTFGTCNPKGIDYVIRNYMPEFMGTIQATKETNQNIETHVIQQGKNQVAINENINFKHDEVMEELRSLRLQNQELQAKYNALVERMAEYIERENGKGR